MDQTCLSSTSHRCSIGLRSGGHPKLKAMLLKSFLNHFYFVAGCIILLSYKTSMWCTHIQPSMWRKRKHDSSDLATFFNSTVVQLCCSNSHCCWFWQWRGVSMGTVIGLQFCNTMFINDPWPPSWFTTVPSFPDFYIDRYWPLQSTAEHCRPGRNHKSLS